MDSAFTEQSKQTELTELIRPLKHEDWNWVFLRLVAK